MSFSQFRQTRTITRQAGSYVDGYWTASGAPTVFTIEASIQPANDKQRKNVPEGYDVDSVFEMGTNVDVDLVPAERGGNQKSDQVTYEGQQYDVIRLERWQNQIIPHKWYVIALPDNE